MTDVRHRMAEAHEKHLAEMLGGRQTRGSGNQWRDQMDGKNDRHKLVVAWAWDGKSTMGKSLSLTTATWAKAVEQADMERPLIGLRFYHDPRLHSFDDLVVVKLDDLVELMERAARG